VKITDELVERISRDKRFWREIAAEVIAQQNQKTPLDVDSSIAEIGAKPQSLGRILESHLSQPWVRISPPDPGPRGVPMIAEIQTVSSSGVVISQRRAQRLKQKWNEDRLRAQQQVQNQERGDAAGEEEEEETDFPLSDHPGQSCSDAHSGMSHDDFMSSEEEEHSNPLFRQNSAGARSISPSRRTRERER